MNVRARRVLCLAAACLLAVVAPARARASSDAGFELALGKFTLQVFYSVANDHADHADRAVQDPRNALFTLASTLQANAGTFSTIDHTLRVDVSLHAGASTTMLDVVEDPYEDPAREPAVVGKAPLERDVATEIVATLCGRYPGACRSPARATLDLYRCRTDGCAGRIRFGAFPSESLNGRFALLPGKRGDRPTRVTRERMTRWFEPLDELPPGTPSTASEWYLPARARISRVARGVCAGCEQNRDVPACSDFALGPGQIRTLLSRAGAITRQERAQLFQEAPCVVRGVARWDGTEVAFEISAFLVATLRFPDGSELLLGCDGACEEAVTGARTAPIR